MEEHRLTMAFHNSSPYAQPIDENAKPVPVLQPSGTILLTAVGSTALFTRTEVVRLVSNNDIHFRVGSNVLAMSGNAYLPAGNVEYLKVGSNFQVSISGAAGTFGYVTIMM